MLRLGWHAVSWGWTLPPASSHPVTRSRHHKGAQEEAREPGACWSLYEQLLHQQPALLSCGVPHRMGLAGNAYKVVETSLEQEMLLAVRTGSVQAAMQAYSAYPGHMRPAALLRADAKRCYDSKQTCLSSCRTCSSAAWQGPAPSVMTRLLRHWHPCQRQGHRAAHLEASHSVCNLSTCAGIEGLDPDEPHRLAVPVHRARDDGGHIGLRHTHHVDVKLLSGVSPQLQATILSAPATTAVAVHVNRRLCLCMLLSGLVAWQGFHLASIQSGTCFASAELMQHQSQLKTTQEYA